MMLKEEILAGLKAGRKLRCDRKDEPLLPWLLGHPDIEYNVVQATDQSSYIEFWWRKNYSKPVQKDEARQLTTLGQVLDFLDAEILEDAGPTGKTGINFTDSSSCDRLGEAESVCRCDSLYQREGRGQWANKCHSCGKAWSDEKAWSEKEQTGETKLAQSWMDIARAELKKRIAMVMLSTITITHRDPIPWHNALDACFNEVIAATYKPASDCAIAEVLTDISIQLNKGYSDRSTVHLTHSDAQAILEYIGKLEQVNYHTHS